MVLNDRDDVSSAEYFRQELEASLIMVGGPDFIESGWSFLPGSA